MRNVKQDAILEDLQDMKCDVVMIGISGGQRVKVSKKKLDVKTQIPYVVKDMAIDIIGNHASYNITTYNMPTPVKEKFVKILRDDINNTTNIDDEPYSDDEKKLIMRGIAIDGRHLIG